MTGRTSAGRTVKPPDLRTLARGTGGEVMPPSVRATMEEQLGADFGDVRLHQGGEAHDVTHMLGARALTVGEQVWLGEGATTADLPLLSHELTHVVQQRLGNPTGFASNIAPALERSGALEAEAAGAAGGQLASTGATGLSVQRQEVAAYGAPGIAVRTEDVSEGVEIFVDDHSVAIVQGNGVSSQSVHATASVLAGVGGEGGARPMVTVNVTHPAGALASPNMVVLDELRVQGYDVQFTATEVSTPAPRKDPSKRRRPSPSAPTPPPSPEQLEIERKLLAIDQEVGSTSMPEDRQIALQQERERLLWELEGAKAGTSLAPPPDARPASPPEPRPAQLDQSIDPRTLTGPELKADTQSLRDWLADHPFDQDASLAAQTLQQYEGHLAERQVGTRFVDELVAKAREAQKGTILESGDPLARLQLVGLEGYGVFGLALVSGLYEYIPATDYEELWESTKDHWAEFGFGVSVGFGEGVLLQLKDDIVGIVELVGELVKLAPVTPTLGMIPLGGGAYAPSDIGDWEDIFEKGPRGYVADRRAKAARRAAIMKALQGFAEMIANDPTFLLEAGKDLGDLVGQFLGREFHEFVKKSPYERGKALGDIAGRIAIEIALLFLGPEEWIARGASAFAKVAEVAKASRIGVRILEFLRRFEELRPFLKAGPEVENAAKALEEARAGTKAAGDGVGLLGEGERAGARALEEAGDVRKAERAPSEATEISQATKADEEVAATSERATSEIDEAQKAESTPEPRQGEEATPSTKGNAGAARAARANTRPFLNDALKKISAVDKDGNLTHPLKFLVEKSPDGKFRWRTTTRVTKSGKVQRGRYTYQGHETGPIVQVGHQGAYASGVEQTLTLEDVSHNLVSGATIETRGGYSFKDAVIIDGVPVDMKTALEWERLELLPPGTVASSPIRKAPEIP